MRTLVKLLVAGLVVHASWRAGQAYWVYYQFRDELQKIAQFGAASADHELQARALEAAASLKVPVSAESLSVRRRDNHIFIDAAYTADIEVLPAYRYPWAFTASVDAWSVAPPRAGDYVR